MIRCWEFHGYVMVMFENHKKKNMNGISPTLISVYHTNWTMNPQLTERHFACCIYAIYCLTLSVPILFLNSPNLNPYFPLNKFERIWLLIFSSLLCLINSHFLITKCLILYVLYKEKLVVDNWLALKGLIESVPTLISVEHSDQLNHQLTAYNMSLCVLHLWHIMFRYSDCCISVTSCDMEHFISVQLNIQENNIWIFKRNTVPRHSCDPKRSGMPKGFRVAIVAKRVVVSATNHEAHLKPVAALIILILFFIKLPLFNKIKI